MVARKQEVVEQMTKGTFDAIVLSSPSEKEVFGHLVAMLHETPIPDDELLANLGLFLTSKNLSRLLFFYEIYQKIIHTHGIIAEFGVRWGQTLSLLSALRGIFEPFNRHRKIVGFDTFAGFKGVGAEDGTQSKSKDGSFSVAEGYEDYLSNLLRLQESLNPIGHLTKFALVKGDAVETVPAYLQDRPETIISLAIFDFDIYRPTRSTLEVIQPHLTRGSILVFDELCDDIFPGETIALREVLGLHTLHIKRFPMTARVSYVELE